MDRNLVTGLIIGAVGGVIIGYFAGVSLSSPGAIPVSQGQPVQAAPIPGAMAQMAAQQRIAANEAAVAADPKRVGAWVDLGNDYFDNHQPEKAVNAYGKALALFPAGTPAIPDILTDQGIMYRELKSFDKAIANFKQANKINPKHLQSLHNLGIVYSQDLHNTAAAVDAWNKVIAIDPGSPQADQARKGIEETKGHNHP